MGLGLLLGLLFTSGLSLAQGTTRTGRITSQTDGSAIPGVNVTIKGTSRGAVTNATGDYSIATTDDAVLVISFIGFQSQEVNVGGQSAINISLREESATLNEVVVTGYASQQRKDVTSAVTVINTKELLSVPAANFAQQLQGRAAGVTVLPDYTPGGGTSIRIRGFGTLGNNDPLYFEPGVYMLRIPNGGQVFGKVAVNLRTGAIWGYPTNTSDPYPTSPLDGKQQVSHPIPLGRFALGEAYVH